MAAYTAKAGFFAVMCLCHLLRSSEALQQYEDEFTEELLIKPLQNGFVFSHFQFVTTWHVDVKDRNQFSHYNLFPKSLGQVVSKYSVQELHLSLTQGQWRHDKWGYPVHSAPPGAELWTWFLDDTPNVDESWKGLVNALSGLFCASLNFIDVTNTIQPQLSFRPYGLAPGSQPDSSKHLRYATLPREAVCTENLAPWKKLLPCTSKAGLCTLLNAIRLYNANYHSLSVHLRPVCSDPACSRLALELTQSLAVVSEPAVIDSGGGRPDWSLRRLFDRTLAAPCSCPMATASSIYVDITHNTTDNPFGLTPEPSEVVEGLRGDHGRSYAVYDLKRRTGRFNVAAKYAGQIQYGDPLPPRLHAHRFVSGYGQQRGGIRCHLYNRDPQHSVRLLYLETVPWFIRLYLHTLSIQTQLGRRIRPEWQSFVPAKDYWNPYLLELVLVLPPDSVTTIAIEFDRAYLKWTEHPPDANLGFHISSAVISAVLPDTHHLISTGQNTSKLESVVYGSSGGPPLLRIHTEALLIQLPVPDFSMPFNVICLTCTVMAIAFGSIHNLTTRPLAVHQSSQQVGLKARLRQLLARLRGTRHAAGGQGAEARGQPDTLGAAAKESSSKKVR